MVGMGVLWECVNGWDDGVIIATVRNSANSEIFIANIEISLLGIASLTVKLANEPRNTEFSASLTLNPIF